MCHFCAVYELHVRCFLSIGMYLVLSYLKSLLFHVSLECTSKKFCCISSFAASLEPLFPWTSHHLSLGALSKLESKRKNNVEWVEWQLFINQCPLFGRIQDKLGCTAPLLGVVGVRWTLKSLNMSAYQRYIKPSRTEAMRKHRGSVKSTSAVCLMLSWTDWFCVPARTSQQYT